MKKTYLIGTLFLALLSFHHNAFAEDQDKGSLLEGLGIATTAAGASTYATGVGATLYSGHLEKAGSADRTLWQVMDGVHERMGISGQELLERNKAKALFGEELGKQALTAKRAGVVAFIGGLAMIGLDHVIQEVSGAPSIDNPRIYRGAKLNQLRSAASEEESPTSGAHSLSE